MKVRRTKNAPLDAVLDHVARHEFDATLEVFGELVLRPVQVPDESLEGVQLPEEVLRRAGTVTTINPKTHTHKQTRHTPIQVRRSPCWRDIVGDMGGGVSWQVWRRMLFLHT